MEKKPIYVTMPTLAPLKEVNELLKSVWQSGIMTHNGPLLQRFEKEVKEWHGAKYHTVVVNGTIALQMAIKALELKGEIITTPFSFIATTSAIQYEGCIPVYVDIDPDTLTMDPAKIEAAITSQTVAIMPVHVFGNSCDIEAIDTIAKKHNLKVIYDACHSVGVQYKGQSVFNYGDISCTSYHATKMLNSGEGGGCYTTNPELDAKLKRIRFFGFSENKTSIVESGSNYKMTEVHASVGLANLKYLQDALDDREVKYMHFKERFAVSTKVRFQKIIDDCNYSYFPVIFDTEESLLKVEKALNAELIYPRRYFYPSLNTFTDIVPYVEMPVSEDISKRILCMPLYKSLSMQDVDRICDISLNVLL
ncbi:DegT/DnrJ/EryC1/StrS family aminotransferase [Bacteroides xylanisolvens]|jgi:aminotransferase|uniref:DegT/DnrJ/EryC1/StrS family aminotransferase n=1 Tax=Bacteroides xylanisolvens TaxID=371601 RepID=UPI001CDC0605|nr:DegT/DnrJ/EryC1/StrS family aminotransferase [Bacteroides xylanisolvens]MCA4454478.1 DegT/DnrJ/EryC1/StrS family aminotransferase [Bacteroides xylanisolvens]MCA4459189.1 DegT/DnrJ/EryC1/StrS family aminotransferase [Bacteroides xylanisolvens]MCA4472783.1 DegT/DnrJ/EryC1/StrS family aminotransferase [Bacteroides xylanisolvens]MCA4481932.1 DegT/DnrJ/EryC1/StrS family aminotransferase [Bacteroides xylanisolvens]MCE9416055.1 DegT/DnrJ/EryC1/StrS family aminotransferase [Bacteroides xylanisolven